MLEVKNLSKQFQDNVVLKDINLSINQGDVVGIIGPSGTGKSTLLRCINHLEIPEQGKIILNGKTIALSKKEQKRKDIQELRESTGMVFQRFNLFEKKTALENVMEGLLVVQNIARALAMKPQLLLLDEPTSALDPELVGEVLETIKKVAAEGFTMMLVSHEMNFVRHVANRVIFLDKGRIVEDGTPKEVFEHPKNERTREFFAKMNMMSQPEYII